MIGRRRKPLLSFCPFLAALGENQSTFSVAKSGAGFFSSPSFQLCSNGGGNDGNRGRRCYLRAFSRRAFMILRASVGKGMKLERTSSSSTEAAAAPAAARKDGKRNAATIADRSRRRKEGGRKTRAPATFDSFPNRARNGIRMTEVPGQVRVGSKLILRDHYQQTLTRPICEDNWAMDMCSIVFYHRFST